jgi:hypothetical protein
MTEAQRILALVTAVAAMLGFVAGWLARRWVEPGTGSGMPSAAQVLRQRTQTLSR